MQDWPERERYTAEDLLQIIRSLRACYPHIEGIAVGGMV